MKLEKMPVAGLLLESVHVLLPQLFSMPCLVFLVSSRPLGPD